MNLRQVFACAVVLSAACAPQEGRQTPQVTDTHAYQGRYEPGCVAFAGSVVTLEDETFVMDRFTDAVRVDADGNIIDPYPDFPKQGRYQLDGDALYLTTAAGDRMETMYLLGDGESFRLLTVEEHKMWKQTGELPQCALRLQAN